MSKSNIFIISGPSGVGEDSVISRLPKYFPIERVITTTTRAMRNREVEGQPYYFVSQEEFEKKIAANELAEYAREYNGNYYGVTTTELERVKNSGKIGIWKIGYKGVATAKEKFPEIVSIYIAPPSLEILEKRIMRRDNATPEYLAERMAYTKEWIKHEDLYAFKVLNEEGKLNETVEQIAKIIQANM
jgi:guanylate kinase